MSSGPPNGPPVGQRSSTLRFERVRADHSEAVVALFERVDCPCYCRYWDYPGDARQWQIRCANERGTSRAELQTTLANGAEELFGVVALADDGTCVGWMRLERPERMSKLYEGRLYRGLPTLSGPRENVACVACFLVDEPWRQTGVARRLLERGVELARDAGVRYIEAFPRRAENVSDAEHWMGPPSLYEDLGFVIVHELGPYPVFRREL